MDPTTTRRVTYAHLKTSDLLDKSSTHNTCRFCTDVLGIKFETSALNDPKITLKITKSKVPHIWSTNIS